MSQSIRVIVNADDFGLHPAINAAIILGHAQGVVTSCSLMTLTGEPSFDEAVEVAKSHPNLDVGLHFALVGIPGLPGSYGEFLKEYFTGRFPDDRIGDILHRQIVALEQRGISPSHIDSHQHLHALPRVMNVVCDLANEHKIPAVRLPLENPPPKGVPIDRVLASRSLAAAAQKAKPVIDEHNLWRPDHFMGMAISGHLTESKLLEMLDRLQPGVTEIVCHPGADNRALNEKFGWRYNWEAERMAVIGERVLYHVASKGIELTTFREASAAP